MGFKPGQSLGRVEDPPPKTEEDPFVEIQREASEPPASANKSGHLIEPLPLDVWSGECV